MADPTETPPAADKAAPPAAPVVDVQAQIDQALSDQDAKRTQEFSAQLKETTGYASLKEIKEAQLAEQGKTQELLDAKSKAFSQLETRFHTSQIKSALLSAATSAVDVDTVVDLLASKGQCDDDGNVTFDGKSAADAVKALLDAKPFLAKPDGGTGSGAPVASQAPVEKNPFSTEHFNLTEQIRLKKQNPALAEKLKASATQSN